MSKVVNNASITDNAVCNVRRAAIEQRGRWAAGFYKEAQAEGIDVVADEELDMEELLRDNNAEMLDSVKEIVETSPEAVAQLLRNWISDDL